MALVSFHQGSHAAEAISRAPHSAQRALDVREGLDCSFCSVLHAAADARVFAPILVSSISSEFFKSTVLGRVDTTLRVFLPGARAPPVLI